MKHRIRETPIFRGLVVPVLVASLALMNGCGGSGGTTSSLSAGSPAGPATVDISIAAADVTGSAAPAVDVAGPGTVPSTDSDYLWPEQVTQPDPRIVRVCMEVVKVSLMPAEETFEGGDMNGEMQNGNSPDPASPRDKPHFITLVPDHPIPIDLLNLKNGRRFARFLNKFDQIPAGTYDKIRVYYQNVVVYVDGGTLRFHPTANSKFDIHFRQGHELMIPVMSDTTQKPDGWVKFFRVKLDVVGLKLKVVGTEKNWEKAKVILRPQIFAEFLPPILYGVAGTAWDVPAPTLPDSGTFNVSFGTGPADNILVAFDNETTWAYNDNVLGHSSWIVDKIPAPTVVSVFRDRATVMAIGPFDTSLVLHARDIVFTFPDVKDGMVDDGWTLDNTFVLRLASDNVVYPMPGRGTAYYDNLTNPAQQLDNTYIDNNVYVKARGYAVADPPTIPGGIEAFWISIGDPVVVP